MAESNIQNMNTKPQAQTPDRRMEGGRPQGGGRGPQYGRRPDRMRPVDAR